MALYSYTSNRLEILADELAAVIISQPLDPLENEIVIVQSHGMDRWLNFALAKRIGIVANIKFPFPARFLDEVITHLFAGEQISFSDWEPEILSWDILKVLPALLELPAFRALRNYISGEDEKLKAFELAHQIAATFDHYLTFRSDMLLEWDRNNESHWQAELWRAMKGQKQEKHPALLRESVFHGLKARASELNYGRVSLFGISYLPPLYLDFFLALSSSIDVHFFLLNPCLHYWGDVLSPSEVSARLNRLKATMPQAQDSYFAPNNALLSSLGRRGREFFDMWIEKTGQLPLEEKEIFTDPGEDTLLHIIQSDLLNLREERGENNKRKINDNDHSVQIHSCHGPMREIEVLQDNLLEFLSRDETLKPSDILVMTPDIDNYAPFIRAVFTLPEGDPRYIPFSIADSLSSLTGSLTKTFFRLGKLKNSRFQATEVLEILSCPAVRKKFGLSEEEWEVIRDWVYRAGIRWGRDVEMRKELNLPPIEIGTWEWGIKRMLLGYALPPDDGCGVFANIVPFGEIEGSDRIVLEGLLKFISELKNFSLSLQGEKSPDAWTSFLTKTIEDFFLPETDDDLLEVNRLYQAIGNLERAVKKASFDTPIPAEIVYRFIERRMNLSLGASGFLTGGITFCHLVPMRSIPFRVVCLVGMNFQSFPRLTRHPSFDLMMKYPRPGDPSRRYDDRYLFLEAILSARDVLYISYTGQSPEDNTSLLPSVVVSEFLDYIKANFIIPSPILTQHRLQAFSPAYFRVDSPLFSYSRENLEAAKALLSSQKAVRSFFTEPLAPPQAGEFPPTLDNLTQFFSHPGRFIIRNRLDISLRDEELLIPDEEPFELDSLQKFFLKESLLEEAENTYLKSLAEGNLPYGSPGVCLFARVQQEMQRLLEKKLKIAAGRGEKIVIDVKITGEGKVWHVKGEVKNVYPQGYLYLSPVKAKGRIMLVSWLRHLILCANSPLPEDFKTFVILEKEEFCYRKPQDPPSLLAGLLHLYEEGLTRPLKLFPEISLTYVKKYRENGSKAQALDEAKNKWSNPWSANREGRDPYYELCFAGVDPLDGEFEEVALQVFTPIFDHLEERL